MVNQKLVIRRDRVYFSPLNDISFVDRMQIRTIRTKNNLPNDKHTNIFSAILSHLGKKKKRERN